MAIVATIGCVLLWHSESKRLPQNDFTQRETKTNPAAILALANQINLQTTNHVSVKLKSRLVDFTDAEKAGFKTNFTEKYKPALLKWSEAFAGRVPFSTEELTTDKFVERIGRNAEYHEYIFVVDGITLGIQDSHGIARVDYLNAPKQTGKMSILPSGAEAPVSTTPVGKEELIKMLAAESGVQFPPNDVRIVPSGFSGSLNGGMIVNVGGNPDNAASWKYDLVLSADGKFAYYLKGK